MVNSESYFTHTEIKVWKYQKRSRFIMRIGNGFDVHKFEPGRKLILGGVEIPSEQGLLGHSDADVLVHAVMDALLGALALGDIGKWFPDTDPAYTNADSIALLQAILNDERVAGWLLGNLDCTIVAQTPKLAGFIDSMRANLAVVFNCSVNQISVKATTTEKLGFCGREEGIAAMASLIMVKK
jgi:2-C-methyl-D-erythritol 2,4-cyclodiphosphate synthase